MKNTNLTTATLIFTGRRERSKTIVAEITIIMCQIVVGAVDVTFFSNFLISASAFYRLYTR